MGLADASVCLYIIFGTLLAWPKLDTSAEHLKCFSPYRNGNLPLQFQLAGEDFRVTSFTYAEIEASTASRLESIRAASRPAEAETMAVLDRIRARFFDALVCPRKTVRGIRSRQELATFRVSRHQVQFDYSI